MGGDKLLLPFQGKPLIRHLLDAWVASRAAAVIVVVRSSDQPLADVCRAGGAEVIQPPRDPEDMKVSVQHALRKIRQDWSPSSEDYWLLAPGDMPLLQLSHINAVIEACEQAAGQIVAPQFDGRRGHPTAFPWSLSERAMQLGAEQGLNVLTKEHPVIELPLDSSGVVTDVDTPEDYQELTQRPENP